MEKENLYTNLLLNLQLYKFKTDLLDMKSLLGIGNALVDMVYSCEALAALKEVGIELGVPNHVSPQVFDAAYKTVAGLPCTMVPGGGAANTVAAASVLGMKCAFMGKVGEDANGTLFSQELSKYNVEPLLFRSTLPTGCTMAFPSSQKGIVGTFIVSIGAAGTFSGNEVSRELLKGYDYLHMEGFLLNCGDIAETVLDMAREQGMIISFDLGSKGLIARYRSRVERIVGQYADIVFANEYEALEFTGLQPQEAAMDIACRLADRGGIAVVKCGSGGSVIAQDVCLWHIGAVEVEVADAIGAGDAYAAGFLHAHSLGLGLQDCGKKAAAVAAAAVSVKGPKIDKNQLLKISARNFPV